MEPLNLAEIAKALAVDLPKFRGSMEFRGVSTDTRTLCPGDLFVALVGEKGDGHDFAPRAVDAGAAGLVVSRPPGTDSSVNLPVLTVANTEEAYGKIARVWRDRFSIPVIGITGSVGKTTTKEMLAAALSPLGNVLRTEGSQNTETGVPKTLLGLTAEHRAAVIEMGTRGVGQIAYLCEIARPTAGIITLIGETHIELFGSRDAIADAKAELPRFLPEPAVAVLNADDPYLPRLRAQTSARVVTFGTESREADYRATEIVKTASGWSFIVNGAAVDLDTPSRHDVGNALAALAAAESLGVLLHDAARALRTYRAPRMRMQAHATQYGVTVLDDAYNASPTSVASALQTLGGYAGGRKMAFLGDMKELGDFAPEMHRTLEEHILAIGGLDALYTVGDLAALIPGAAERFADSRSAAEFAARAADWTPGDVVLVKGSRSMAMERIVDALIERFGLVPRDAT
jgi:UDP-N-acetylmuramoyl-tripeptide--D-alanyl-D-alanine ligase